MKFIKDFITYYKNKNQPSESIFSTVAISIIFSMLVSVYLCAMSLLFTDKGGLFKSSLESDKYASHFLAISIPVLFAIHFSILIYFMFKRIKKQYNDDYQEIYKQITTIPDESFYIKNMEYKNDRDGKPVANAYEIVIDCSSYFICMYLKNGSLYCKKINKATNQSMSMDNTSISHYSDMIEKRCINIHYKNASKIEQNKLNSEADEFFNGISKAIDVHTNKRSENG